MIKMKMTMRKLLLTMVVVLALLVLQACTTLAYYFYPEDKNLRDIAFNGFSLTVGLATSSLSEVLDKRDSLQYQPEIYIAYLGNVRDTASLDTMGVVYIDSLCYRPVHSDKTIWATNGRVRRQNPAVYTDQGTAILLKYTWAWDNIYLPLSEKSVDMSFVAIWRHSKTGEDLGRQRFSMRLKRDAWRDFM